MKKTVLIVFAAIAMIYAACSHTHYYGIKDQKPAVNNNVADTAMGGDAMKKDSTMH